MIAAAADHYGEIETMLQNAKENALFPSRLSFGLVLLRDPDKDESERMREISRIRWITEPAELRTALPILWQGEDRILTAAAGQTFRKGWDAGLALMLDKLERGGIRQPLLTCYPPEETDWRQAALPVAGTGLAEDGSLLCGPGMPLRYAIAPQRCMLINPECCYAPSAFFRQMAENMSPLYLEAFRKEWRPYIPSGVWIRSVFPPKELVFGVPEDEESRECLKRLDRFYDTDLNGHAVTGCCRQGINVRDLIWRKRVPLREKAVNAGIRFTRKRKGPMPLFVTCRLKTDNELHSPEENAAFFRMLADIREMVLLCYADEESIHEVELKMPNVAGYRTGLEIYTDRPMRPEERKRKSKASRMQLLLHSREKVPGMSHWIWLEPDILQYPVNPDTALRLEQICTDRIVIGTIRGKPDPSMIAVPDLLLEILCRAIREVCETSFPEETALWEKLMLEHADWFSSVEIDRTGGLFSTMINPKIR